MTNQVPHCRITRSAPTTDELLRISRTEIAYALTILHSFNENPALVVHECRKTIKRLRALLRLGGDHRGEWREPDSKLRRAGKLLAGMRDADVIGRILSDPTNSVGSGVLAADMVAYDPDTARGVAGLLADVQGSVADIMARSEPPAATPGDALNQACRRIVGDGSRFRRHGLCEDAHRWRKGVQRYLAQLRYLVELFPGRAAAELDVLAALAQALGDYNDLTVLGAAIESGRVRSDKRGRRELTEMIGERQARIRDEALCLDKDWLAAAQAGSDGV